MPQWASGRRQEQWRASMRSGGPWPGGVGDWVSRAWTLKEEPRRTGRERVKTSGSRLTRDTEVNEDSEVPPCRAVGQFAGARSKRGRLGCDL